MGSPGSPDSIVFLMQDLAYGGTQRQMLELARRLDRGRFHPAIWTCTGATALDGLAGEYGLPVTHLGRGPRPTPRCLLSLWGRLLRQCPDVLVACTALPNVWGRLLGRLRRVPVVVGSCRGGGALRSQHEWLMWRLARHIICNSTELYDGLQLLGVPAARRSYIPNGVDTEYFHPPPLPRRGRGILSVGRFVADKDQPTLLRAFALVLERVPDATLCLVGEGPLEDELRALVDSPDLRGRASLVPPGPDPRPHYTDAGIFALSSVREGQPNVLLEAMATGLPVVATSVGGIPGMVRQEVSGLLCPPGEPAALARCLCRLLEDAPLRLRLGAAGRQLAVDNFSLAHMVGRHEALFARLLEEA